MQSGALSLPACCLPSCVFSWLCRLCGAVWRWTRTGVPGGNGPLGEVRKVGAREAGQVLEDTPSLHGFGQEAFEDPSGHV